MIELITANLSGRIRQERLDERDYLVAPLTLIVPGVLNGSQGPLFYSQDELAKNPSAWDNIPIVVYHPTANGTPISASDERVEHIGLVLKTNASTGKLVAEGWFDVEKTRSVDGRVLSLLQRGEPIELSTGLITDQMPGAGEFNGIAYQAVATNYRPDHLAILPDLVGACSIRDGCGVLVNEGRQQYFATCNKELDMPMFNEAQRKEIVDSLIANCECWDEVDREVLSKVSDEKLVALQKHVQNVQHANAIAEAARKGFNGVVFNEKELKFEAAVTVVNTNIKPKTDEEWLAEAPPGIQSVVRNAMAAEAAQRQELVEKITANHKNIFTKEYLLTKSVDELRGMAALAHVEEARPSFYGSAVPALNRKPDYDEDDILPLPEPLMVKK